MADVKASFHVLVIGAGSTGLLIAQGLKRAGISCRVYERVDADTYKHRQRDWTMGLHWGSDFLETCLPHDLLGRLKEAECDPLVKLTDEQERFLPFHNALTGERISMIPAKSTRRVSREKFRKLASSGLDIRYNSKIINIEDDGEKVTAGFEDGHTATGSALIGCDSAYSFVRTYLLGPERAACETVPVPIYNFTCSYSKDQAIFLRNSLHPLVKIGIHPELNTFNMLNVAHVGDPDDPTTWIFQNLVTRWAPDAKNAQTTPEARLADFKSLGSRCSEPWRSASCWVKDDQFISADKLTHWPNAVEWDNHGGRITLAGDAAHPMLPFRGQGFNNGLEDAAHYVETLCKILSHEEQHSDAKSALKNGVDAYDKEVLDRGIKEIKLSYEQVYKSLHMGEFKTSPMTKYGMNKVQEELSA